jgi:hypothetical protein
MRVGGLDGWAVSVHQQLDPGTYLRPLSDGAALSAHVEGRVPRSSTGSCTVKTVGVTACEREETRAVVLVHVNDLGLPSAKSSPYLEGSWVRERANRA